MLTHYWLFSPFLLINIVSLKLNWFPLYQFIHFIYLSLFGLAILNSEERRKFFNSTAFIKLECMRCPWALQAKHSGNYKRHFFFGYFSPKKGCPKFCMRPWIRKDCTLLKYFDNPKLKQGFHENLIFLWMVNYWLWMGKQNKE